MIIGREQEIKDLRRAYESEYSEFVAVTGRRRIGKTFLVREVFGYKFTFQHSGLANQKTRQQLKEFQLSTRKFSNLYLKILNSLSEKSQFSQLKFSKVKTKILSSKK